MTDLQQALCRYFDTRDRVARLEAKLEGAVITGFQLGTDLPAVVKDWLTLRVDLTLAIARLAAASGRTERPTDAQAESPESAPGAESAGAPSAP